MISHSTQTLARSRSGSIAPAAIRAAGLLVLVIVAAGRSVAAPPPTARLTGTVRDAATHTPLTGVTVMLRELKRGAITRRDGSFTIEGVPTGEYTLSVTAVGYAPYEAPVALTQDIERRIELVPRTTQLSEVRVTGKHEDAGLTANAHSVTVITPVELARTRGQTFGEALKNVAGVSLLSTGPSISKPVIRGLHSQRVVLVNAGVQQEGQQWGSEHAPEIDPFAPSSIEVLRGAAGVEYGAGAIGGVIRLAPRPLRVDPGLGGELSLNGFSNNMQGSGSLLLEGATALLPGFGARVQASARKAGDSRTADYVIGNSGFEEIDGSAAVGYHQQNLGADLYLSHFGTTLGIFKGSHVRTVSDLEEAIALGRPAADYQFGYDITAPKQEISHDVLSFAGHYVVPEVGRLELQYGYQYNHRKEYDAHNVRVVNDTGATESQRASFELGLATYSLGLKLRHNTIGDFTGTFGVEGSMQRNSRGGSIKLIPSFQDLSGGVFLIENAQYGALIIDAGARLDCRRLHVDPIISRGIAEDAHDYASVSGAVGAVYQVAPEWSVGANVGTAWRPPSVNELYSNDVHHGSAQYEVGDRTLANERSVSADMTLRYIGERGRLELSAYANRIGGYIYLQPDPEPIVTIRGAYPLMRYRQTNALLYGFDGTVDYRLLDPLRVGATLSIVRGEDVNADVPLIQMPADHLRLNAHADLPDAWGVFTAPYVEAGALLVRCQDRFPKGVDYVDPPPGYTLFDVSAGAAVPLFGRSAVVGVSVENMFNTAYRDYMSRFRYFTDDPGRNVVVRLSVPFGSVDENAPER